MSRFRGSPRPTEKNGAVVNFMGGESYQVNPLDTLKMITASSVFGEPSYYRKGSVQDARYRSCRLLDGYLLMAASWDGRTTTEIMESAIDQALDRKSVV